MRKQLRARVTAAEYEAACTEAQKITKHANHAQIGEAVAKRLRDLGPHAVSSLIRVACALMVSPEDTSGQFIRVRVRDADEEATVARFLASYGSARDLGRDIAARLRDRAPLTHPSDLFRAVVGLPAAQAGAPKGRKP